MVFLTKKYIDSNRLMMYLVLPLSFLHNSSHSCKYTHPLCNSCDIGRRRGTSLVIDSVDLCKTFLLQPITTLYHNDSHALVVVLGNDTSTSLFEIRNGLYLNIFILLIHTIQCMYDIFSKSYKISTEKNHLQLYIKNVINFFLSSKNCHKTVASSQFLFYQFIF